MLAEAEDRLSAEWAAMGELRAAAVAYDATRNAFECNPFHWDTCRASSEASDRLHAAARLVAELEET